MAHRPRVVAVIVLLIVAAVALHGYLPGVETPAARPADQQLRQPVRGRRDARGVDGDHRDRGRHAVAQPARLAYGAGEPPREMAGERRPLTWRMMLIAVAVVIAWLLLVALLSRMNAQLGIEAPPPDAGHPAVRRAPAPAEQPEEPEPSSSIFSLLAGSMVLLMMVVFVGAAIAGRRQRRSRDHAGLRRTTNTGLPQRRPAPDPLARAAEAGAGRGGRSEPRTAGGDHRVLRRDGA